MLMRRTNPASRALTAATQLRALSPMRIEGRVASASGLAIAVEGLGGLVSVGARITIAGPAGRAIPAEIVGFDGGRAQAMPFGGLDGIAPGLPARLDAEPSAGLAVSNGWLGRVLDPLGNPIDGKGAVPRGPFARPTRGAPPPATQRARLGPPAELGVRALDCFATCRQGQRLGLFAGSGIGKSTLLSMLARGTACDVVVLALVGERGREVREFLEDDLGPEGLARAVTVVATSDAAPLLRRQAAWSAMAVAEHFRDHGRAVLLLMDSVTRFALALREIGLAAGEPPATRGYPPSVFAELPRLLERAGPGVPDPDGRSGSITGLFTVLVEGDDHNEPIADAARGILDGHVVLDRRIAEAGRFPAIDVLRSLSRAAAGCLDARQAALVRRARGLLALAGEVAELARLGAYRAGSDPSVDEALRLAPRIEAMLRQDRDEISDMATAFARLREAMEEPAQ